VSATVEPSPAGWLQPLRGFFAALMFLTRLPTPGWVGYREDDLARSTPYFPLVGALVGIIGGGVFWVGQLLWPIPVAVALSTAATVWLTGAFHEDALADACDGLGGGWGLERILAIMKDSRIGSYGAVGLILVLAVKMTALASLPPAEIVAALIAAHVLGRWSSLPLIHLLPYVRDPEGTGKPFAASVTMPRLVLGTVLALALVIGVLRLRAIPALLAAITVTALGGRYFRGQIGGVTGDCLGAANQMVEVATYLVLAAEWPFG
jgi:adenosylcobinamide-GDP ribazoletransferase